MKLSKMHEHLWNMHMFQVDEEVVDALKGSGFENMLAIAKLPKLNTCMALIKYMVENYDTVDHCFLFPNDVRLYLSLKDVFFIWGLPITSQPIIGTECHGREISRDYFPNLDVIVKNRGFNLSTLKEIATDRAKTLEIRVRATVMYILGNLVVPDRTRNSVKAWYLYFLKDIEKIKNFAWGELLLVQIHFSILKCKEKDSSGICGSMYTLMIFALIHLKNLQRLFGFPEDFGPRRWPLIEDWSTQVQKTLKNAYAIPNDAHIQNVMTNSNNEDVIWSPYPIFDQVPACYKRNFRMFLAVISMFINNLCVFHTPHMSPQQFDMPEDTVEKMTCVLPRVKRIKLKGNQGTGKKNYWTKWEVKLKCKVKEIRIKALNQDWLQFAEEDE